jgi:hypothetical protein
MKFSHDVNSLFQKFYGGFLKNPTLHEVQTELTEFLKIAQYDKKVTWQISSSLSSTDTIRYLFIIYLLTLSLTFDFKHVSVQRTI